MDAIYLTFSSLFLVFVTLTAADPDPWDDHGYHRRNSGGGSYGDSGYGHSHVRLYKPKGKTVKCYQCAYSPGKTTYKEIHEPVSVRNPYNPHEKKVEYRVKKVPVRRKGGWDKCLGPFNDYQARAFGIDVWECHENCYTRIDANGNLFRGCYKGEYDVNPNLLGCNKQAGDVYCFCEGNKCNNAGVHGFGREGRRY